MVQLIKPTKIITQNGECTLHISLDLNINLNSNGNISASITPSKSEMDDDKVELMIPDIRTSEKLKNFGKVVD